MSWDMYTACGSSPQHLHPKIPWCPRSHHGTPNLPPGKLCSARVICRHLWFLSLPTMSLVPHEALLVLSFTWCLTTPLHLRASVGLCANMSLSLFPWFWLPGVWLLQPCPCCLTPLPSPCPWLQPAVPFLPLLPYSGSYLLPALGYSAFRLPSTLPSPSGPGCWQKGGFSPCPITLPSVADKVSCISPLISSKIFSKCQGWE